MNDNPRQNPGPKPRPPQPRQNPGKNPGRADQRRRPPGPPGPPKHDGRFHQYRGFLLLTVAALAIWMNSTFLIPLTMGVIFAVVLQPLMTRFRGLRLGTTSRAAVITMLFAISFLIPIGLIVFLGAEQALSKIQSYQTPGAAGPDIEFSPTGVVEMLGLGAYLDQLYEISPISPEQLKGYMVRAAAAIGAMLAATLQKLLASIPAAVFSTFIILITIFFLLIDGKRALAFMKENSFFGPRETDRIFEAVDSLCHSVIVASIAAGLAQSALIVLACFITGTEGAILIGLVSFIASFLPVIGTAPVTVFLTAQAFFRGEFTDGLVFLVFIVLVGLSDNIVRPYVLKGGGGLHPLVGFVAAFGALDTIGFYGVFIGPVVAGLFFALLPIVTNSYGREQVPL